MIYRKDIVDMLEQWKGNFGETYMDEMVALMIDVVINKINAMPDAREVETTWKD